MANVIDNLSAQPLNAADVPKQAQEFLALIKTPDQYNALKLQIATALKDKQVFRDNMKQIQKKYPLTAADAKTIQENDYSSALPERIKNIAAIYAAIDLANGGNGDYQGLRNYVSKPENITTDEANVKDAPAPQHANTFDGSKNKKAKGPNADGYDEAPDPAPEAANGNGEWLKAVKKFDSKVSGYSLNKAANAAGGFRGIVMKGTTIDENLSVALSETRLQDNGKDTLKSNDGNQLLTFSYKNNILTLESITPVNAAPAKLNTPPTNKNAINTAPQAPQAGIDLFGTVPGLKPTNTPLEYNLTNPSGQVIEQNDGTPAVIRFRYEKGQILGPVPAYITDKAGNIVKVKADKQGVTTEVVNDKDLPQGLKNFKALSSTFTNKIDATDLGPTDTTVKFDTRTGEPYKSIVANGSTVEQGRVYANPDGTINFEKSFVDIGDKHCRFTKNSNPLFLVADDSHYRASMNDVREKTYFDQEGKDFNAVKAGKEHERILKSVESANLATKASDIFEFDGLNMSVGKPEVVIDPKNPLDPAYRKQLIMTGDNEPIVLSATADGKDPLYLNFDVKGVLTTTDISIAVPNEKDPRKYTVSQDKTTGQISIVEVTTPGNTLADRKQDAANITDNLQTDGNITGSSYVDTGAHIKSEVVATALTKPKWGNIYRLNVINSDPSATGNKDLWTLDVTITKTSDQPVDKQRKLEGNAGNYIITLNESQLKQLATIPNSTDTYMRHRIVDGKLEAFDEQRQRIYKLTVPNNFTYPKATVDYASKDGKLDLNKFTIVDRSQKLVEFEVTKDNNARGTANAMDVAKKEAIKDSTDKNKNYTRRANEIISYLKQYPGSAAPDEKVSPVEAVLKIANIGDGKAVDYKNGTRAANFAKSNLSSTYSKAQTINGEVYNITVAQDDLLKDRGTVFFGPNPEFVADKTAAQNAIDNAFTTIENRIAQEKQMLTLQKALDKTMIGTKVSVGNLLSMSAPTFQRNANLTAPDYKFEKTVLKTALQTALVGKDGKVGSPTELAKYDFKMENGHLIVDPKSKETTEITLDDSSTKKSKQEIHYNSTQNTIDFKTIRK